ncbi:MAG: helicase-related protein [bacterium]
MFKIGQIVSLKSNQELRGAVIEIIPGQPEDRCTVFLSGTKQTFYASQLQPETERTAEYEHLPVDYFHARLTALQIRHPGLSALYSLNAARVDFIPYQYRPVLKFIRSDRPRLLIADSVGVGKTIEAGLILRELQSRRDIRSILIICPRPLVIERKWETEMKRFDERFTSLDGKTLRYCISEMDKDGYWPDQYQKVIIPYSLFDETLLNGKNGEKKKYLKGLLDLDPAPRFDVVIIDEAHHVRNPETYAHKVVRFFCDNAEAVLFLTATPIQLGSDDLFVLLNLLRSDLIIDRESFSLMAEPNPFINRAVAYVRSASSDWIKNALSSLNEAAATQWGGLVLKNNPEFQRIVGLLQKGEISPDERVGIINNLESLHTFSRLINRTRRRDIGEFTMRKPETVSVDFTPSQKKLHDELLEVQAKILALLHGDVNVKFMMTTICRQAASCLYGLAPFIEDRLTGKLDDLDDVDNNNGILDAKTIEEIKGQVQGIIKQAENLDPYDPKLEALKKVVRDKQKLINNKVMLFSTFRHTLNYLYRHLQSDGFRVGLVHGGVPDEERRSLRDRFQLEKTDVSALDILLFSEIGCEGLDYQFCDCLTNYDLPWNPMRIEQRIGRIDRNGQRSESVIIYNFVTPGTIDAEIYNRCLLRIGIFNSALGGSEEILGEINREIRDIAENISLSAEERQEKFQQLADNKIRLLREQEELEEKQVEFFGIRLPANQFKKEVEEASSFWLTPGSIQNIISCYLKTIYSKEQELILGEKALKTLRLSQEARNRLIQDLNKLPRETTPGYREWEKWLKGNDPLLPITFDSDCASKNPKAAFITPVHPIVRQSAMAFDTGNMAAISLTVKDNSVPAGIYPFVIYQWHYQGILEDVILQPVTLSEKLNTRLVQLLEKAEEMASGLSATPDSSALNELDNQHRKLWSEAVETHRKRTEEQVNYKRESLNTSHKARISLLNEQLSQAKEENIKRMRNFQIANAEADYNGLIAKLDAAVKQADIRFQQVACGVIKIEGV